MRGMRATKFLMIVDLSPFMTTTTPSGSVMGC